MGSMKTLSALWAADYLMKKHPGMKTLVVAPLSILKDTWANEIDRNFLGRRRHAILHGSAEGRQRALGADVDFYITNVDGISVGARATRRGIVLDGFAKELCARKDIGIVIFDEAAAYRDPTTKRCRVARHLAADKPYVWLLTGSPMPHSPLDAYGLAKLVKPVYNESRTAFRSRTMVQVSQFKWVPRRDGFEQAAKLLTPAVRFSIDDCVDLPPCYTLPVRDAELSGEQKARYKDFLDECVAEIDGKEITAVNEGALRWKLLQVACGAIYDDKHKSYFIDAKPRMRALAEMIAECREKIIVFAPLTSVLHLLYDEFKEHEKCAIINGEVKAVQRAAIFEFFQRPGHPLRIIFADPGTMAHGLNLTAATAIIWYAPIEKAEIYMQALKRIHRPGQNKVTQILRIAATEEERKMYKRLEEGRDMNGVILDLVNERRHR